MAVFCTRNFSNAFKTICTCQNHPNSDKVDIIVHPICTWKLFYSLWILKSSFRQIKPDPLKKFFFCIFKKSLLTVTGTCFWILLWRGNEAQMMKKSETKSWNQFFVSFTCPFSEISPSLKMDPNLCLLNAPFLWFKFCCGEEPLTQGLRGEEAALPSLLLLCC